MLSLQVIQEQGIISVHRGLCQQHLGRLRERSTEGMASAPLAKQ